MTAVGYAQRAAAATAHAPGPRLPAAGAKLIGWAARVPWYWAALLTLILGCYQLGRPELWRDELASWSFGTRPLSSLIATARHTGATQLACYLLLHVWIVAFRGTRSTPCAACPC
jgi:mannosyltransferase